MRQATKITLVGQVGNLRGGCLPPRRFVRAAFGD